MQSSSTENTENDSDSVISKYSKYDYQFIKKARESSQVDKWLAECGLVSLTISTTATGTVEYYRCSKLTRKQSALCPVRAKIERHDNDVFHRIYCTTMVHKHEEMVEKMPSAFQEAIIELKNNGTKPLKILSHMKAKFQPFKYNIEQIRHVIRKNEKANIEPVVSIGDLISWAKTLRNIPINEDSPFVLAITHLHTKFNIVFSTLRLLSHAAAQGICADATYQTNWQGFPVIITGGFDAMQKFHMFALSVSSNETSDDFDFLFQSIKSGVSKFHKKIMKPDFIMCDAAAQIKNGFLNTFPHLSEEELAILMCFFHVKKAINSFKFVKTSSKEKVKFQLNILQLCANRQVFNHALQLFLKDWAAIEPRFVEYFKMEWVQKSPNWFCCANLKAPNTNNGIEGFNSSIKANYTFRRRLPLSQFKETVLNLLKDSSEIYTREKEQKIFHSEIILHRDDFKVAIEYIRNPATKSRFFIRNSIYYILSERESERKEKRVQSVEQAEALFYSCSASSFAMYESDFHQTIYQLEFVESNWMESTCTCPSFMKSVICKHILTIGILRKVIKCPVEVNPTILGQKPKRGRTKNAKSALCKTL